MRALQGVLNVLNEWFCNSWTQVLKGGWHYNREKDVNLIGFDGNPDLPLETNFDRSKAINQGYHLVVPFNLGPVSSARTRLTFFGLLSVVIGIGLLLSAGNLKDPAVSVRLLGLLLVALGGIILKFATWPGQSSQSQSESFADDIPYFSGLLALVAGIYLIVNPSLHLKILANFTKHVRRSNLTPWEIGFSGLGALMLVIGLVVVFHARHIKADLFSTIHVRKNSRGAPTMYVLVEHRRNIFFQRNPVPLRFINSVIDVPESGSSSSVIISRGGQSPYVLHNVPLNYAPEVAQLLDELALVSPVV